MAIPDFQSIMLPLLQFCSDGEEHTNKEAIDNLIQEFSLTENEQKALLPSGRQRIIDNRIAWARAHMKMAGLLENTRRGIFRITKRGQHTLKQNPSEINLRFLRQLFEYEDARQRHRDIDKNNNSTEIDEHDNTTPQKRLEEAYLLIRENLANDLLIQLKAASASFF